jgi:chromosome segregation ATPase
MMQAARLLIPCLWLAACQSTPPKTPDWAGFLDLVERMDEQQLRLARESALRQYSVHPTDANRLRAGYALSRPVASLEQLAQGREILAEISVGSDLAAMRDLLDAEIRQSMALQEAELRTLELQAQLENLQARLADLQARLGELQTQLNALKAIEKEMTESQQQADEEHP